MAEKLDEVDSVGLRIRCSTRSWGGPLFTLCTLFVFDKGTGGGIEYHAASRGSRDVDD